MKIGPIKFQFQNYPYLTLVNHKGYKIMIRFGEMNERKKTLIN